MKVRTHLWRGIIVDVYYYERHVMVDIQPPPAKKGGLSRAKVWLRPKKLGAPRPAPTKKDIIALARKYHHRATRGRHML